MTPNLFYLSRKWAKRLLIACCACLLSLFVLSAVNAESVDTEVITPKVPVVLDGRKLYKVSASGNFTANERANTINALLQEKLDKNLLQGQPVNVTIHQQAGKTVLQVNNRYLVSITAADLIPGMMPQEQQKFLILIGTLLLYLILSLLKEKFSIGTGVESLASKLMLGLPTILILILSTEYCKPPHKLNILIFCVIHLLK